MTVLLQEPSTGTIIENPEESSDIPTEPESKSAEELEGQIEYFQINQIFLSICVVAELHAHLMFLLLFVGRQCKQ